MDNLGKALLAHSGSSRSVQTGYRKTQFHSQWLRQTADRSRLTMICQPKEILDRGDPLPHENTADAYLRLTRDPLSAIPKENRKVA